MTIAERGPVLHLPTGTDGPREQDETLSLSPDSSRPGAWLGSRVPLTTLLPLTIALAMFVVALGSTQIGIHVLRQSEKDRLRDQAVVYLDAVAGVVANVMPISPERVAAAAGQLLVYRTALLEEAMAIRWTDASGTTQTVVIGDTDESTLLDSLAAVDGAGPDMTRVIFDRHEVQAEATRTYAGPQGTFAIAATFDAKHIFENVRSAGLAALGLDIAVALMAALATYVLTRQALRPLHAFIDRLADDDGVERRLPIWEAELTRLEMALIFRERSEATRHRLLSAAAQRERDAVLARLAATLAHEVRNPLTGLISAVSTLRRFGDQPAVRERNLELLERGLSSIGTIVDTTLAAYRRRPGRRRVLGRELRELDLLVAVQARHSEVTISWDVPEEESVETDADALRQILLNLLLNAVRVSPRGGMVHVRFRAGEDGERAAVSVRDQGAGMSPTQIAVLTGGTSETIEHERSIGIWLVADLVQRIGAQLSIESGPDRGTSVTVILAGPSTRPADLEANT